MFPADQDVLPSFLEATRRVATSLCAPCKRDAFRLPRFLHIKLPRIFMRWAL